MCSQIDTPPAAGTSIPAGGFIDLTVRFTATSNSNFADQRAAAAKLADALFDGFPGRSGETIEVR